MAGVKITNTEILSDQKFVLKKISFELQKGDGSWEKQDREVFDHGNAVTALLYNREKRTVVLGRQFRIPTYINGNPSGMLLETCAGLMEEGEGPDETMKREIEEETGYKLDKVQRVYEAYSSAGAYTELLYYYIAEYSDDQKTGKGGGLEAEGEEIRILEMPFDEAVAMMDRGELRDAKTILLLQYALIKGLL